MKHLITSDMIARHIYLFRSQKVMLDRDLADMYGVEVRIIVRNVKRNIDRFPSDFMFQLSKAEYAPLRSQIGILDKGRGRHRKYLPYVFSELGVAMLSSVLNSKRAIHVNIRIMRTFVEVRKVLSTNNALAHKLEELGEKIDLHDAHTNKIFFSLRKLIAPIKHKKKVLGFQTGS